MKEHDHSADLIALLRENRALRRLLRRAIRLINLRNVPVDVAAKVQMLAVQERLNTDYHRLTAPKRRGRKK